MEVFVTKALKKIRKETSRKHKELRDSCDAVLSTLAKSAERQAMATKQYNDALKANGGVDTGNVPPPPPSDANADKYFEPFRLACASKKSEIMETALYCLHNLIAYGYLRGAGLVGPAGTSGSTGAGVDAGGAGGGESGGGLVATAQTDADADATAAATAAVGMPASAAAAAAAAAKSSSAQPSRRLIDVVVDTVCSCTDHTDHGVQLQVIKALLTAVTSSTCEVHETSLLAAVRACYHIHLVSDNLVNKTTAKATLTQVG